MCSTDVLVDYVFKGTVDVCCCDGGDAASGEAEVETEDKTSASRWTISSDAEIPKFPSVDDRIRKYIKGPMRTESKQIDRQLQVTRSQMSHGMIV
jgi:hypothetical protein